MNPSRFLHFVSVILLVATGLLTAGCDKDEDYRVTFSPMLGTWTLQSIDGVTVAQPDQNRYLFRQDPDDLTFNSGLGSFEEQSGQNGAWVSTPVTWQINDDSMLVIEGAAGGGVFDFQLEENPYHRVLTLYDPATDQTLVYLK